MAQIPTVKVEAENPRGYNIINRRDFDPERDTLHPDNDAEDFDALGIDPPETGEEGGEEPGAESSEEGEGQDTGEEEEEPAEGSSEPEEEPALTLADFPAGDLLASKYENAEALLADLEAGNDEEILSVTGVGPATLEDIQDFAASL